MYDRVHAWASKPGGDGVTPIDHHDVKRLLGEIYAMWRINELLNWQVAAAGEDINVADAASTKSSARSAFSTSVGSPRRSSASTATRPKSGTASCSTGWTRNQVQPAVITFGGGVNEVMREMIAASGLKVPRVPRRPGPRTFRKPSRRSRRPAI